MTMNLTRKEAILQAAQKLFSKFGLAKTTIEDIARGARMGKASIYYYFRNKEAIFAEVIETEGRELRSQLIAEVTRETTPQAKLKTYVITRIRLLKQLANYYKAFKDEYLKSYAFIEKAREDFNRFEKQFIASILEEGKNKGVFEVVDVDLTAEAILAAIKGLEYHWTISLPMETIQKNVDILLSILFKGIEKR